MYPKFQKLKDYIQETKVVKEQELYVKKKQALDNYLMQKEMELNKKPSKKVQIQSKDGLKETMGSLSP